MPQRYWATAIINNPDNKRGLWHSDWPFNHKVAGHIPAPYPDAAMHLTTIWMLSPFSPETGGTLIVPGSHRANNNPTGDNGVDPMAPYPTEMQATGEAGSVLLFDSRLWHSTATNRGDKPRVGVAVRYAPWWLNLDVLMPGSDERSRMVDEAGTKENQQALLPEEVFAGLPDDVKPLYRIGLKVSALSIVNRWVGIYRLRALVPPSRPHLFLSGGFPRCLRRTVTHRGGLP